MSNRLIQIVAFTNVAPGATATLPHALNQGGAAVVPDFVDRDNQAFTVLGATSSTVTVRNDGDAVASCNVWLERKHTVPRVLGGLTNLSPQPFIAGGGGASGGDERLTVQYHVPGTSRQVRYLRPGGDNGNDGLTPATAWAGTADGLYKALSWLAVASYNQQQVIDITGCDITVPTQLNLGGPNAGTTDTSFDFAGSFAAGDYSRATCQIIAAAQLVQTVTITGATAAAGSGLYTINVAETLTVNALRGKFLVEEGLGNVATIRSNTANQIVVCSNVNPQTWVNPAVYQTGARITAGDPLDFFSQATFLQANCDWFLSGIEFVGNGKTVGLSVTGPGPFVSVALCDIHGLDMGVNGAGAYLIVDGCYLHDGTLTSNGISWILRTSYLRTVTPIFHTTGVFADLIQSVVENHAQPFGGGVSTPATVFRADNSEFRSGAAGGVLFGLGTGRLTNCVVADNTGNGVTVQNNAFAILNNVRGTGNTGRGVAILNGAQARVFGGTNVTGVGGDILLGAGTINYAAVPTDDVGAAAGTRQLVRVTT